MGLCLPLLCETWEYLPVERTTGKSRKLLQIYVAKMISRSWLTVCSLCLRCLKLIVMTTTTRPLMISKTANKHSKARHPRPGCFIDICTVNSGRIARCCHLVNIAETNSFSQTLRFLLHYFIQLCGFWSDWAQSYKHR